MLAALREEEVTSKIEKTLSAAEGGLYDRCDQLSEPRRFGAFSTTPNNVNLSTRTEVRYRAQDNKHY
jgi:hypothetical protein